MPPRTLLDVSEVLTVTTAAVVVPGRPGTSAVVASLGGREVVAELLAVVEAEYPVLADRPGGERVMVATWLAGYRSARTRRAYAADLTRWLDWLAARELEPLQARRVHVDLWVRQLLDADAVDSSVTRRLSAVSSWYRHLAEHDLIAANPAAAVRRPRVDPDHTTTVGLDRDQARGLLAAADTGRQRLRSAAAVRLLLHQGLRVDELCGADVADLGHDRGHQTLTVTRKGGARSSVALPAATGAALRAYLDARAIRPTGPAPAAAVTPADGPADPGPTAVASPKGTLDCVTAFGMTDFRDEVAKIAVPTLVIHGDSDQVVPFEVSGKRSHEAIVGSELVVIEGGPHAINATHPAEFNQAMLAFLAK